MEDVQKKFDNTIADLKDNARQVFNELAGSYLRDVIRGKGQSYNRDEILSLNQDDIKDILNRVEENTLSDPDKKLLQESISRLSDQNEPNQDDSYIAHIFSKLITTSRSLKEKETPLRNFVDACNKYLDGKTVVYNELKYSIAVYDTKERKIELQYLSSGEKQIVSLFSHLYLSRKKTYMIMIDEPELSLSMPWQHTFLPDIMSSGHCDFIAAVTHSPFISDNELDRYTVDMKKCVKYS
jgi:ABC-type transport system involved in cytochrome c biogenesis ATPase subunit